MPNETPERELMDLNTCIETLRNSSVHHTRDGKFDAAANIAELAAIRHLEELRDRVAEMELTIRGDTNRASWILNSTVESWKSENDRLRDALESIHRNEDQGSPAWLTAAGALGK